MHASEDESKSRSAPFFALDFDDWRFPRSKHLRINAFWNVLEKKKTLLKLPENQNERFFEANSERSRNYQIFKQLFPVVLLVWNVPELLMLLRSAGKKRGKTLLLTQGSQVFKEWWWRDDEWNSETVKPLSWWRVMIIVVAAAAVAAAARSVNGLTRGNTTDRPTSRPRSLTIHHQHQPSHLRRQQNNAHLKRAYFYINKKVSRRPLWTPPPSRHYFE